MNDNQKVFSAITGFEASYKPKSASQDYDESNLTEILELVSATVDNADLIGLDINPSNVDAEITANAIFSFHKCDTGCGNDCDVIFNSLQ